jgi:hypothetical protein
VEAIGVQAFHLQVIRNWKGHFHLKYWRSKRLGEFLSPSLKPKEPYGSSQEPLIMMGYYKKKMVKIPKF